MPNPRTMDEGEGSPGSSPEADPAAMAKRVQEALDKELPGGGFPQA